MILTIILLSILIIVSLGILIHFHNHKHNPALKDKKHIWQRLKEYIARIAEEAEKERNTRSNTKYSYYSSNNRYDDKIRAAKLHENIRQALDNKIKSIDGTVESVDNALKQVDDILHNLDTIFDTDWYSGRSRKPKGKKTYR